MQLVLHIPSWWGAKRAQRAPNVSLPPRTRVTEEEIRRWMRYVTSAETHYMPDGMWGFAHRLPLQSLSDKSHGKSDLQTWTGKY